MEEDIESSSGASMLPIALALLALVLGASGLYFGLNANQRISPLSESVEEGSSSAARIDKVMAQMEAQITQLATQNAELRKRVERLGLYGSQSEKLAKQAMSGVSANREELVKLAEKMNELASGVSRQVAAPARTPSAATPSTPPSNTATSTAPAGTYQIQSGDTFGKISSEKGVSLQALLDANPDADPRRLRIGQTINIPSN